MSDNTEPTLPSEPNPRPEAPGLPSGEPDDLFSRAREAVAALRGQGRQADGTAGIGNTLNLRHGLRSLKILDQPDISAWHQEEVETITADLGGAGGLTALKRASIREAARLELIMGTLGDELLAGGVLTGKGKMRAATSVYLHVLDRFMKMAATVGLERRAKPVNPLEVVQRAVEEVNQP